jgi:hypothetical protein
MYRLLQRSGATRWILQPLIVSLGVGLSGPAMSDAFTPSCHDAAPGFNTVDDFEFNSESKLTLWQTNPVFDAEGNLIERGVINIAPFDDEGNILTKEIVECQECSPAPMAVTQAGPEFVRIGGDDFIYFTSMSEDESTVRLGKLAKDPSGNWNLSFLPDSDGKKQPQVGVSESDQDVKIVFYNMIGDFHDVKDGKFAKVFKLGDSGWRYDESPPVDMAMDPRPFTKNFFTGTYIDDASKKVFLGGLKRNWLDNLLNRDRYVPAIFDFDTNEATPLLSETTSPTLLQFPTWPKAFEAPELGDEWAVLGVVKPRASEHRATNELVFWKRDSGGTWVEWNTIPPVDPDYPCLWHPEPFTLNGKSYVVVEAFRPLFCAYNYPIPTPSIMWIASIDPDTPEDQQIRRIVSQERNLSKVSIKTDAEVAIIDGTKARIYYRDYFNYFAGKSYFTVCDPGL